MEEKKQQFVPNIPASRSAPVREPKKQTDRTQRKRAPKKNVDPAEAIASGPFALGPAKRSVKTSRIGGTSSSTSLSVKVERLGSPVPEGEKIYLSSDESMEEPDIDFDNSDPNIPCNICRSTIDDDHMKVEDQQGELILFQVPDILTSLIASSSSVSLNQSDMVTVKQEDTYHASESKNGRIGTLFIDENGRMELKMANGSFDLSRAPNSLSYQKLVLVEGKRATNLGKVSQRIICTPQIDKYQK